MTLSHCEQCCSYTESRPFSDECVKCRQPKSRPQVGYPRTPNPAPQRQPECTGMLNKLDCPKHGINCPYL